MNGLFTSSDLKRMLEGNDCRTYVLVFTFVAGLATVGIDLPNQRQKMVRNNVLQAVYFLTGYQSTEMTGFVGLRKRGCRTEEVKRLVNFMFNEIGRMGYSY